MNQRPSIDDILSGEPIPGRLLLSRACFRFGSTKQNSLHQTIFTNCRNSRPLSGTHSCIESVGNGVQSENIQRICFAKKTDVTVLRYYRTLPEKVIDDVINSARRKVGTEYSISEAGKSIRPPGLNAEQPNRQFCTRFVAQAYYEAGHWIVENPNYCTPNDIMKSNMLVQVDEPLRAASEDDLAILNEEDSLTRWQAEITYNLMKKVREMTRADLQDFEQIGAYLIQHPKYDDAVVKLMKELGYLTMWMAVRVESPHFYDYKLLEEAMPDVKERRAFALQQIEAEPEIRKRAVLNYEASQKCYHQFNLQFFKALRDLNLTLINESKIREAVLLLACR